MCGIAGFIGTGQEETLRAMVESIRHRGPDYQGVFIQGKVGLAHARLSIIDLSEKSNQPFFTPDKKHAIVFNGEIYNYLLLKEELLKTGKYAFDTSGDTEVLLYLYLEHGTKLLEKIQGMFAFAIYDFEADELFLARDRMGKKPLYYTIQDHTLVFASELKAVVKHPSVKKELNLDALNEYLTLDYIPTPDTILKNIYKLEAGSFLIFRDHAVRQKEAYWNISYKPADISFADAGEKLESLLNEAVRDRLMSDVPLGVFLSGGLDSSAVAYFAQKNSSRQIKTFSIGFNEKSYDESDYAKLVAKKIGTDHYEQTLTAAQSLELIPEIIAKLDEPYADPSIIPTYFLSKFTRQYVSVALGGDGSDELLAGYPTFITERFAGLMHAMPTALHRFLNYGAGMLPASDKNISLDFKIKQFLKGFESKREHTHSLWLGSFTPKMKNELFTEAISRKLKDPSGMQCIDTYLEDVTQEPFFNQLLYVYCKTYLQDDILVKVDRASMFNSLEVRAPFLDTRVVDFINSLPKSYKIEGNNVKRLLKEVMRNKIPDSIIDRPKKGFGIPVSLWLRNELRELCEDLLSPGQIQKDNLFNYAYIETLKQEHLSGRKNHRKLLWNLIIFQLWKRHHFDSY
jgi:asparagine synthase (glutamine-hydrolysing)